MRKLISILLLFLLCLQAIPLVQFVVEEDLTYSWVDEDKPEEGKVKGKKAIKEFCPAPALMATVSDPELHYAPVIARALPCPYLETFTPPPNTSC
ncbi:MAG: hypothetical protein EOO16_06765 [Chitinophagaceae bacterium]|nr:MAG: hypothetical protein EOO16_06765 [Chitinophagaceae bacterium]